MLECIINNSVQEYIFTNLIFYSFIESKDNTSNEIIKDIFLEFRGISPEVKEEELKEIVSLKIIYNDQCILHINNLIMNKYVNESMHERFKTSQFKLQYRYNQEDVYVSSITNI